MFVDMNLKKIGNVQMSKSVGTGPSSYEKIICRAAVSQKLRNTGVRTPQPQDLTASARGRDAYLWIFVSFYKVEFLSRRLGANYL